MKKTIILIISILVFYFLSSNYIEKKGLTIPNEAIRIRVLANSNSQEDQNLKYVISDKVMNYLNSKLYSVKTIEEARNIINNSSSKIQNIIENVLLENNIIMPYKLNFGYNYFPQKKYKNEIYKEGYYESLLITLGEGLGDNFWCLLFPPLCLLEADIDTEITYSSFFSQIFK